MKIDGLNIHIISLSGKWINSDLSILLCLNILNINNLINMEKVKGFMEEK
jgi:hypothetical protein